MYPLYIKCTQLSGQQDLCEVHCVVYGTSVDYCGLSSYAYMPVIFSTSISGAIYTLNIESTAGADASVEALKLLDLDLNVIGAKMIDQDRC